MLFRRICGPVFYDRENTMTQRLGHVNNYFHHRLQHVTSCAWPISSANGLAQPYPKHPVLTRPSVLTHIAYMIAYVISVNLLTCWASSKNRANAKSVLRNQGGCGYGWIVLLAVRSPTKPGALLALIQPSSLIPIAYNRRIMCSEYLCC